MTINNGYATNADFLARLSNTATAASSADDDVIDELIESASRMMDSLTFRRFYSTSADETRYFTATNPRRIYIDDLLTITSLSTDEDGDRTYETTWLTTDYDLMPGNALFYGEPYTYIEITPLGQQRFPRHNKGVKIVGTFGFSATAPTDVKDATLDIAMNRYQGRRGMGITGMSLVSGAGVVVSAKDVTEYAWKVINNRRKNWGG